MLDKYFKEMLNKKITVGCSHDGGEEYNIDRSLNDFIVTLENELEYAPLDEIEHQNLLEFIIELKKRLGIKEKEL